MGRFLLFNLLASLAAGLIAWGIITAALRLLQARSAFLHTSFLVLPLIKSVLILSGLGFVFPWPGSWFVAVNRQALPLQQILPFVLIWFAVSLTAYYVLSRQQRNRVLLEAVAPTGIELSRLNKSLTCVLEAYQKSPCCRSGEWICCISDKLPENPLLLISEDLRSPAALIKAGRPAVIFPRKLIARLDDTELAMAMSHELNHFALRKPVMRSSDVIWILMLVSPIAFLLSDYLDREEEKACDDLAVMILGQPEMYAGMLVKSYQFAREQRRQGWFKRLPLLPQLIGRKPFLSQRVERLLESPRPGARWMQLPVISYLVWSVLLYVLFFARFTS